MFRNQNSLSRHYIFGTSVIDITKIATLVSLHINLAYSIFLWKEYPKVGGINQFIYPTNSWFEIQNNLNLPFIILSIFILIIAVLTSWYSLINSQLFLSLILLIEICLISAFSCTNIFVFLLFFEASALPIFILMAYCGSDRRERLKASYYFIFFTLYGSLSLLLFIANVYVAYQIQFIYPSEHSTYNSVQWALLFIAFAVKIPLFPFHLWLPYAHVEANTSTSILLAALMLKLGGYGLIKFMLPLFTIEVHWIFQPAALLICAWGVLYGGLSALRQLDLKRQIAFSSISHMSFATLGIFMFNEAGLKGAIYLMLSHGLTSAALFYTVGMLSERYHTRSIMAYGGLLGVMPVFSFFVILFSLANVGFPGTSGFLPEVLVLASILRQFTWLGLPVLLGMFLTTASSLLLLLRSLFGHVKVNYSRSNYVDVTKLDCIILGALGFWVIILGLIDILG